MTPTRRLYFDDSLLLEFEARILERRTADGRPAVILDRTAFYPESGGQPWDLGTLAGVPVLEVVEEGEVIVHVLEREIAGDEVRGLVDGARRFDHMQQHSGQHILSQAFIEVVRGETRSFHLGAEDSTLEISLADISEETLARVEGRANGLVFENREVTATIVARERIAEIPLRRPPKVEGDVRVVEVGGFDHSACGGTHVRRTGEIGLIKILGWERIRGNLRFSFVCGGRALAAFTVRNRVVRDLVGRFHVRPEDIPAAVDKLAADHKDGKRHLKRLEDRLAGFEAEEFMARADGRVIAGVLDDRSPESARALALAIVRRGPVAVCFGTVSEARSHLLLARSEDLSADLRALVSEVAAPVRGKGGGGPSLVEIAGDRDADLSAAVAQAAAKIRALLGS